MGLRLTLEDIDSAIKTAMDKVQRERMVPAQTKTIQPYEMLIQDNLARYTARLGLEDRASLISSVDQQTINEELLNITRSVLLDESGSELSDAMSYTAEEERQIMRQGRNGQRGQGRK
jgi:hypothetical protein